jgi:hypothetical protein
MTDEVATELARALNRLAEALEAVSAPGGSLFRGIQVHHHGAPSNAAPAQLHAPFKMWNG